MEYVYASYDISDEEDNKTVFQIFGIDTYDNEFERSTDILIPGFSRYLHDGGKTAYSDFTDIDFQYSEGTANGAMYKYLLEKNIMPYYAAITNHLPLLKHELMFSEYGAFNANCSIIAKGNMEVVLLVNSQIDEVSRIDMTVSFDSARLNIFKWAKNKNIKLLHKIRYTAIERAIKNNHKDFVKWYKQNY